MIMEYDERDIIVGLVALVGGIVSGIVVALPLSLLLDISGVLAGVVEEPAKVIGLIFITYKFPEWLTSKKKTAIFGGLAGLGFAFTENMMYYLGFLITREFSTGLVYGRTFLSLPSHMIGSALVGMGLLHIASKGEEGYKEAGKLLLVATVIHGLWNAFPVLGWGIFVFIIDILVFRYFYQKSPEYPIPDEQIGILKLPEREVWITRDRTFGRKDFKNDLSLEDLEHISKEHFKITRFEDTFFIEDSGSKGGTRLNETEIKGKGRQELKRGAEITLPPGLKIGFATKADIGKAMEMKTMDVKSATVMAARDALSAKLVLPDGEMEVREREYGREDFMGTVPDDKLGFISGRHFGITRLEGEHYIDDLESTNGTRLNGEEIKGKGKRKLKDGDEILVANVLEIRYVEQGFK
jgi:pSer/pThr/pTyr-binding forkhead associated (FHA) protein